jgi:hypothetical protein
VGGGGGEYVVVGLARHDAVTTGHDRAAGEALHGVLLSGAPVGAMDVNGRAQVATIARACSSVSSMSCACYRARLSLLDRFLPVWIGAAMVLGIVLGRVFTGLDDTLDAVKIDTVSLPIAIGLLAMMYPVLAKVKYARSAASSIDRRSLVMSLVLNWLVGPR